MATVKFLLNRPKGHHGLKKSKVSILARFSLNGTQRIALATGEQIEPKYWNSDHQQVKPNYRGHIEINLSLQKIELAFMQCWRNSKEASLDELKEKFKLILNPQSIEKKSQDDLDDFIQTFIADCRSGKITRTKNTIQIYESTLVHLHGFCMHSGYSLSFDSITLEFYYDLLAYLWDEMGHCDTTVGKIIKTLKTFMEESAQRDLHQNFIYKKKQFRKPEGESESIYLTEQEILKIYNIDLVEKGRPDLIESRDLFVFDCWVGLRYSDLTRIKPEHVNGNTIRIRTTKTGEDVVIPFHHIAQAIFRKHGNALPRAKSNPQYNKDLKDIANLAGLNDRVQRRRIYRSTADCQWVEKWQQVTAHTARRSFATNCYKLGVPTRSIMAITGHKTEKAFNKYIKISKEEHSKIMADVFAKQVTMKVA
jgi:integrase